MRRNHPSFGDLGVRWLLLSALTVATACSSNGTDTANSRPDRAAEATTTTSPHDAILTEALECDPFDERACLLPWPNDAFTKLDPTTPTGRRLDIQPNATPLNASGSPIGVDDQNRADGFSPGSAMLAFVPELDLMTTGIATSTDIGASLDDDAPIVVIDTSSGERVAYWAELDAQAPVGEQLLMIRPATSLLEGHRYVVGLRNMRDTDGNRIPRSAGFEAALNGQPEPLERSRAIRELLAPLEATGVDIDELYLAWNFTVASSESIAGRLLHMRQIAYAELAADGVPEFRVTAQSDDGNVRRVDGTFQVPNFLTGQGDPGSTFVLDDDGLPLRNNVQTEFSADFHCVLPLAAPGPVPAIVFGHGLLGSRMEVDGLSFAAEIGSLGACATDEIGMSNSDIGNLASILGDFSNFNQLADRMQQGLLNQQLLGRLLNSPDGFARSLAFQNFRGEPLLQLDATQFVGNSQGGVLGGAASAISTEWSRVVLGVPGINYSLLLHRSSNWPFYQAILDDSYPDPIDRVLAIQLIQLLWDRGENNGYVQHLTADPFPGITSKQVLLVAAFGDHQVANISTEVLARTIGAVVREPALADGRSADVEPLWNIDRLIAGRSPAAALVVWDFGTPAPPTDNRAPFEPDYGVDPHGAGLLEPWLLQQVIVYLLTGELVEVCGIEACTSNALND